MTRAAIALLTISLALGCNKLDDFEQPPELTPLEDGFRASAAIAYSVSMATRALTGKPLPSNVTYSSTNTNGYSGSGIIHVQIDDQHRLPFNSKISDITIAGLWNNNQGGVISIIFSDFDLASSEFKFYGIHTIPVVVDLQTGNLISIFAEQDIVIGEGSDTLMNISLSKIQFDSELQRTGTTTPTDTFVAASQNVWHISIDQSSTTDLYADEVEITGGGQIAQAKSTSGGILYHAMIDTRYTFSNCSVNPTHGSAFIQNIMAGSLIDFGTILLDFHSNCDGKAQIKVATGKYATSNGKTYPLNWQ